MGTTRTRQPVPPVEPTDDVAPLVADDAPVPGAPTQPAEVIEEAAPEPPTRFVVARHAETGATAVLARGALEGWPGWEVVRDHPDSEYPQLPAPSTELPTE